MNRLYYFLGVIIPIPLFFDLSSLNFIIRRLADGYLASFGAPIPISIFLLAVTLSVFSIKGKIHTISLEALTFVPFLMFFVVLSVVNIGMMKTLMLLFPFVCMYFVIALTKNIKVYENICLGYITSFLFIVLLHFFSVLYYSFNGEREAFFLFNSMFGILIYQALISYSAVLSYAVITLFIFSKYKSNFSQKTIYFFIFIILILLSLGARKAVLLDVGILFSLLFSYGFVESVRTSTIKKTQVMSLFLFPILVFVLLLFTGFSNRVISLAGAVDQRGESYNTFFSLMANADLTQALLGHGGDWGGYSNIYVEMIYRLGVVGFLMYFIAFFISLVIVRKKIKYLFNFDKSDYYFSIWFWFTVLTIALSNMFNMNLQLPYYSINLTMIMMTFLYQTKYSGQSGHPVRSKSAT